jgi:hypothetical protein
MVPTVLHCFCLCTQGFGEPKPRSLPPQHGRAKVSVKSKLQCITNRQITACAPPL